MTSYTTAQAVQNELRLSTAFSSVTLPSLNAVTSWIEQDSADIDRMAGRVYGETEYTEIIDYNGSDRIQLEHAPIISVSSLLYSTSALGSTGYSLTTSKTEDTDFVVYNKRGEIMPLFSNWSPKAGERRMQITYTAGFVSTDIPSYITKLATKMAALRVLESALENSASETKSGKSISVGSISIVKSSDIGVNQYKELKTDIQQLKKDLGTGTGIYRYTNY